MDEDRSTRQRGGYVLLVALVLVVLASCSARSDDGPTPRAESAGASTGEADPLTLAYTQHALTGTTTTDESGTTLRLIGMDQTTTWVSDEAAGVLPTAEFVDQWDDLGLDSPAPQAAVIPASVEARPVVVQLADPVWDAGRRTLSYRVSVVSNIEPRLDDLLPEGAAPELPADLDALTLLISQPDAPRIPRSAVTTTTTTASTVPPDTATPPSTTPSPSPAPSPGAPPAPSPQPQPAPPPFPPSGQAFISVSPLSLAYPTQGGVQNIVLTNSGSGVGSWSVSTQDAGFSASPVSGYLFPGSQVVVSVVYNGNGPASDFASELTLTTSNGVYVLPILVG